MAKGKELGTLPNAKHGFFLSENMDNRRKERLKNLLNQASAGNLPKADEKELSDLITDYYVPDSEADLDDLGSDSESEPEDDGTEVTEVCDEEADAPLVHVQEVREEDGDREMEVDAVPNDNPMLARARQRCCKRNGHACKQIKVPAVTPGDTRRGCITQFRPEEIVDIQLKIAGMDKGRFIISYVSLM